MTDTPSYGSKTLGYLMTLGGALCWAIGGSCGQLLFQNCGVTSNWLIPIRLLIAGSILLVFSFIKYPPRAVLAVWRNGKDARDLLLFTLFGACASQYAYYTCIQYSNAAFATVLSYMFPVVILLYNIVRSRRAPRLYEWLSVLLVTVGAISCSTHWNLSTLSVAPVALILGLFCAVTSAYNTVKPQRLLRSYALISIMGWSMTLGGLFLCLLCRPWTIPVTTNPQLLLLTASIILIGTILAFSLYQGGVRIVGSVAGSVLAAMEPAGAIVIAALFLHVPFTLFDTVGFLLILSTIPIIAVGQHRQEGSLQAAEPESLSAK